MDFRTPRFEEAASAAPKRHTFRLAAEATYVAKVWCPALRPVWPSRISPYINKPPYPLVFNTPICSFLSEERYRLNKAQRIVIKEPLRQSML